MFIIKYKKFFLGLSLAFVIISLGALLKYKLPLGIDFKGGSQMQITFVEERPNASLIQEKLINAGFNDVLVKPTGSKGYILKSRDISETERAKVVSTITNNGKILATEDSFTTIGPSVGAELRKKAVLSIVLVLIAIILFVAYAFRHVSKPVSSWKYGFAVIIALAHDIIIPIGAFAILGHIYGFQLDTLFVVALLTTLALSVTDTIVVFDRIRENLKLMPSNMPFSQIVGESLSQTFVRSIGTSFVVLIMVITLAIVGPSSTKLFATVLAIGMFFGTYSSIFLASPLLVLFEELQNKK